ncbi:hypothetical protein BVX97_01220 [bacterium E08(2017)]|nr:hypothetical protein BVX97_01220 [bacterium E08(2017)]
MYKYLFGPVPSRRLGRSLGIDLVPLKVCSFNCVFCQAGITSHSTTEREEYVPISDVLSELDDWLESGGKADFITFSGSGEPTLNSGVGEVIKAIQNSAIGFPFRFSVRYNIRHIGLFYKNKQGIRTKPLSVGSRKIMRYAS